MNNNSAAGILLAFFGGVAAGVAVGYWLNSDKGRKLRTEAQDEMSELEARIEAKVKEAFASARRKAEEVVKN